MHPIRLGLSLLAMATLSACGDTTSPNDEGGSPATRAAPGPWDTLAALPPEAQPYGLDVYTAKCVSCHGNIGQGVDKHPPLKGLTPIAMQQKLRDYRAGALQGAPAAVMTQAMTGLSDAEIASVALYAGE